MSQELSPPFGAMVIETHKEWSSTLPLDALWINEHGPQGGDELNLVLPGLNYGWPVIGYGVNYGGADLHETSAKDGMVLPCPLLGPFHRYVRTAHLLWRSYSGLDRQFLRRWTERTASGSPKPWTGKLSYLKKRSIKAMDGYEISVKGQTEPFILV